MQVLLSSVVSLWVALAARLAGSRKLINGLYLVAPPLGLVFMYASPAFNARERAYRTFLTAGFLAFFATMGPELSAYLNSEMARLALAN